MSTTIPIAQVVTANAIATSDNVIFFNDFIMFFLMGFKIDHKDN